MLNVGTATIQSVSKTEVEYVEGYASRRDTASLPMIDLSPIGVCAWKVKDKLINFRVGPARYPDRSEYITAKTIADAGAKYKRMTGLYLLNVSKRATVLPINWPEVILAANRELASLAQNEDTTKWLTITVLGYDSPLITVRKPL